MFDLEQVLYLPKSQRSELFYKRRLANYNFTVYNLATKERICFLSHEGQARRGANEIASNLNRFLVKEYSKGVKTIEFFFRRLHRPEKKKIDSTWYDAALHQDFFKCGDDWS